MKDISLNFGALKESILKLSSRNFLNDKRSGVDEFAKELNESKLLMKQHLAFKSLNTDKVFGKERLAERFINQTLELFNGVSWERVLEENGRLRMEYLDNSHVGSTTNSDELYNAIQTLIEAKCKGGKGVGYQHLEEEQNAYEFVVNSLMSEKKPNSEIIEEGDYPKIDTMWEYATKIAINNFNKRYDHLSESEGKLVNLLLSPSDKKINYLKDLKNENNELLNTLISLSEEDGRGILESFKSKLDTIDPEKVTEINDSIISCFQLKESLEGLSKDK